MAYTLVTNPPGHETYQEIDHSMLLTKYLFNRYFGATMSTVMTAATAYFLKEERGTQVIYLPIGFNGLVRAMAVCSSTAGTGSAVTAQAVVAVSRDDTNLFLNGATSSVSIGTATIPGETAGAITIALVRNTTVNGIEITINKATNNSTGFVTANVQLEFIAVPYFKESATFLQRANGTTAATVVD